LKPAEIDFHLFDRDEKSPSYPPFSKGEEVNPPFVKGGWGGFLKT